MGFFDRFKKNKNLEQSKTEGVPNFFNFPQNEEGIKKITEWLKQADEIILALDASGNLVVRGYPDETVLVAYTDLFQRKGGWEKHERIATVDFEGLKDIFAQSLDIDALMINPDSDSVMIFRHIFSSKRKKNENATVYMKKPDREPRELVEILLDFAKKNDDIEKIYLSLMKVDSELSYLVSLEQNSAYDFQVIDRQIGERLKRLYAIKGTSVLYPVDFTDKGVIGMTEADEYVIYSK